MKRLLTPLMLAAVLLLAVGVHAGDKLDGKKLFRTHCKTCHFEDSEAGDYAPMYLIIEQWERFYDEDYLATHGDLTVAPDDTTKFVDTITPEMLKAIRDFSIYGAADSEHPMTCSQ